MCRSHDDRTNEGFTLTELLIAMIVGALLVQGVVSIVISSGNAYESVTSDTNANYNLRRAMDRITGELRDSASTVVTIDTTPSETDVLTYKVPVGRTSGGIVWGADGVEGQSVRLRAEDGQLLRVVLDVAGDVLSEEILATGIDGADGGTKGFEVTRADGLVNIAVSALAQSDNRQWRKRLRSSVVVRNDE